MGRGGLAPANGRNKIQGQPRRVASTRSFSAARVDPEGRFANRPYPRYTHGGAWFDRLTTNGIELTANGVGSPRAGADGLSRPGDFPGTIRGSCNIRGAGLKPAPTAELVRCGGDDRVQAPRPQGVGMPRASARVSSSRRCSSPTGMPLNGGSGARARLPARRRIAPWESPEAALNRRCAPPARPSDAGTPLGRETGRCGTS